VVPDRDQPNLFDSPPLVQIFPFYFLRIVLARPDTDDTKRKGSDIRPIQNPCRTGGTYAKGFVMMKLFSITAITAVVFGAGAAAAELPTFELMGFPITTHQVALIGSAHLQEQSPNATIMFGGMPASPHQITVLTPRPRATGTAAATQIKTGGGVQTVHQ
jgi:hypothetical protein